MIETKAVFRRKDNEIEAKDCVVNKVIRLSGMEFDRFSRNLMSEWSFIRNNPIARVVDENGRYHCLLVLGEERRDGILVNPEGSSYARYSAFLPNAELLFLEYVKDQLSDPTVTRADMYAYGYGWDGMIPLSKEGALALWDKGHEIFRLYENDAEGAVDNRADIENFDGLFGVEDPAWEREKREESFEAFIINRERYSKGEAVGEWLALPADADTLRNLLERIGVGEPSEEAFTVTAVRVPMPDYLRDHVTKYGSLDEMNMLAAYLRGMADFEFGKFQAILAYNGHMVGNGTAALINLLDEDNLAAFNMIPAEDAETLGRYYAEENDEKPDDVSFEQYGRMCQQEEGGVFTEWGYLYPRYGELLPMYTGTVPNEYRITDEALCGLRSHTPERGVPDEKPSVLGQIREARNTPPTLHRQRDGHNIGEPDL